MAGFSVLNVYKSEFYIMQAELQLGKLIYWPGVNIKVTSCRQFLENKSKCICRS